MALQAFLDESDGADCFVLAGYAASPQSWDAFTVEWQQLLRHGVLGKNDTYQFKMSEMALNAERMERASWFYRVIEKHAELAISVQFRPSELQRALDRITFPDKKVRWGGWPNPYFFAFRALTDFINVRREELEPVLKGDEKIDFIFDAGRDSKGRIINAWETLRKEFAPEIGERFGAPPRFEDDEKILPLQAADFWAWWVRKWAIEAGADAASHGEFPWSFQPHQPPKAMVYVDEDGIIEYILDIVRTQRPDEKYVVLPKG